MSTYVTVLSLLADGVAPETIARKLDRREDAVRGMIETMARRGHVEQIDCADGTCSSCPMADACGPMESPVQYVVSEAGWQLVDDPAAVEE